jgi:hypothetical protein
MYHVEMMVGDADMCKARIQRWEKKHPTIPCYKVDSLRSFRQFLHEAKLNNESTDKIQAALVINVYAPFVPQRAYFPCSQPFKELFQQKELMRLIANARHIGLLITITTNYYFHVPCWVRVQAGFDATIFAECPSPQAGIKY